MAAKTDGLRPLLAALRTASTRVEGVPAMAAGRVAIPAVVLRRFPRTARTPDAPAVTRRDGGILLGNDQADNQSGDIHHAPPARVLDRERLDLVVHHARTDVQQLRRVLLHPVRHLECLDQRLALDLLERDAGRRDLDHGAALA